MKKVSFKILIIFLIIFIFYSCKALSQTSENPSSSKIYTSDITNFYTAFDLAINDTINAKRIFKKYYFSKGTKGLKDFYKTKIKDLDKFSEFVIKHKEFYKSIRKNISDLETINKEIYENFESFKKVYPKAVFPNVYFVIGRFSSNGTISKRGLLIGTEILCRTENTNTEKWNKDILRISMLKNHIPTTVSHELIHFNQDGMKDGNTLLWKSIREGSAEFIAELINGNTDADYSEFKGREIEIWNDFKIEMDKNIWKSWQQKSEKRPRNAGYWTGYMICKSYYNQIRDKERVVNDILNIKDYKEFYENSKVDEYIIENFGK